MGNICRIFFPKYLLTRILFFSSKYMKIEALIAFCMSVGKDFSSGILADAGIMQEKLIH